MLIVATLAAPAGVSLTAAATAHHCCGGDGHCASLAMCCCDPVDDADGTAPEARAKVSPEAPRALPASAAPAQARSAPLRRSHPVHASARALLALHSVLQI